MSDQKLQRTTTLAAELRRAADELRREEPPASLLAGLQRSLPRRRWRPFTWAMALASAGAALLALAVLPGLFLDAGLPGPAVTGADTGAGFVPVADAQGWRQAAQGRAGAVWLVSTEMPRERLAALGLPYDPARAGERVRAQLLMRDSGDVLAVRVIP